jgi:hypothetical protein
MESPDSLIAAAEVAGFELIEFEDTTPSLVQHFTSIIEVRTALQQCIIDVHALISNTLEHMCLSCMFMKPQKLAFIMMPVTSVSAIATAAQLLQYNTTCQIACIGRTCV